MSPDAPAGAPFTVETIEVHAEGEPGRVIPNADRFVAGATMAERFDFCVRELDGLRGLLLREPRGYPATCGVFLLPPVTEGAHFGIVMSLGNPARRDLDTEGVVGLEGNAFLQLQRHRRPFTSVSRPSQALSTRSSTCSNPSSPP